MGVVREQGGRGTTHERTSASSYTSPYPPHCPKTKQFQYDLKGISFLPRLDAGAYPQMPYQEITEAQYREVRLCVISLLFDLGVWVACFGPRSPTNPPTLL